MTIRIRSVAKEDMQHIYDIQNVSEISFEKPNHMFNMEK